MSWGRATLALVVAAFALAACTDVVDGHPLRPAESVTGTVARPVPGSSGRAAVAGLPDFRRGVLVGPPDASVKVEVYDDLQCPACAQLEPSLAPMLEAELTSPEVSVRYLDLSFLDAQSQGNHYSTRAANAALCAAQVSTHDYLAFRAAALAAQPAEQTRGRTDDQLLATARSADVESPDFATCVRARRFAGQVATIAAAGAKSGITAVPAVFVSGQGVPQPLTATAVRTAIEAAK